MQQVLENFFKAVRSYEIDISAADSITTAEVIQLVGIGNRQHLRAALTAALAKTELEKERFQDCFDRFFHPGESAGAGQPAPDQQAPPIRFASELANLVARGDRDELALAMRSAAALTGVTDIWAPTQKGIFSRQIMQRMGLGQMEQEMSQLARQKVLSPLEEDQLEQLRLLQQELFQKVKAFVESQLQIYGKSALKKLREENLLTQKLADIDRRDFRQMQELIRQMARKLARIHTRKRRDKQRGVPDIRKTLRRNQVHGGVLMELFWKQKTRDKARVMALCDVSGSVRKNARFLLLFLYSLGEVIDRLDSYVFTHNLYEVGPLFDKLPVEEAIEQVMNTVGMGSSDYGSTLLDLKQKALDKITPKTTVMILGDGRNNKAHPHAEVLELVRKRSKQIIWLNPEPETFWALGDSEMKSYAPYCTRVRHCSTLQHLERVVDSLLASAV